MCPRQRRGDRPVPSAGLCTTRLFLAGCLVALAWSAGQAARQPPVLIRFEIGDGSGPVRAGVDLPLVHRVAGGRPSHYRVSRRADFEGAQWASYREQPTWRFVPTGAEPACGAAGGGSAIRLYFQVRTVLGEEVKIQDGRRVLIPLTAVSNVLSAAACVFAPTRS